MRTIEFNVHQISGQLNTRNDISDVSNQVKVSLSRVPASHKVLKHPTNTLTVGERDEVGSFDFYLHILHQHEQKLCERVLRNILCRERIREGIFFSKITRVPKLTLKFKKKLNL